MTKISEEEQSWRKAVVADLRALETRCRKLEGSNAALVTLVVLVSAIVLTIWMVKP